jgi:glycosyltransferase involved in cell wall biosynthesis
MNIRVLYLFAGPRRKIYEDFKKGKVPGIDLVGINLMSNYSIDATFLENRYTEFFRKISFNLTQLPVFFRLHTCDVIFSGSGILTVFLLKSVLRLKKPKWVIYNTYLSNLLKRNVKGLKAWVIKKAIFSADAIVSPSLSQYNFLKSVGLPEDKNYYLPYGIDYDFFNKSDGEEIDKTSKSERYIFSSGRDIGRDYKTLIEAVKGLPVKLLIATLPRNLNDVTEWPLNVSVAQFDQTQMAALMKGSEFIVIPTISESKLVGSDCSGQYALLRSMTCGKAVITSARSTLVEYFTSGQHGLTVKPENVAELRESIMLLWNDPAKARAMGKAGQVKIKNQFTMEIFSRKLSNIFHEVASK